MTAYTDDMADDDVIPPPTSFEGVGTHIAYLRRDIKNLTRSVETLANGFVKHEELTPVKEAADTALKNTLDLQLWRENLTGKLVGFGIGIAAAGGAAGSLVSHLLQ